MAIVSISAHTVQPSAARWAIQASRLYRQLTLGNDVDSGVDTAGTDGNL
jgi:hypothetical protein